MRRQCTVTTLGDAMGDGSVQAKPAGTRSVLLVMKNSKHAWATGQAKWLTPAQAIKLGEALVAMGRQQMEKP